MGEYRQASMQYLGYLLSSLKYNKKQTQELREEKEKWEGRIELAEKKNRPDLKEGAQTRLNRTEEKLKELEVERIELKAEADKVRMELRGPMSDDGSGVDAQALARALDAASGSKDSGEEREFAVLEAEKELENLKKELHGEETAYSRSQKSPDKPDSFPAQDSQDK